VTSGASRATFGSLRIDFDERVLRPRAWTQAQAWWAAQLISGGPSRFGDSPRILELCAGAGQIGLLTLAVLDRPDARLVAVDANAVACEFSEANARHAGLDQQVEVRQGDVREAVQSDERFDLVLADPPWVERTRVRDYPEDPVQSIDGGDDGLAVATKCFGVAEHHLSAGSSLLIQLGSAAQVGRFVRQVRGSALRPIEARHVDESGSLVQFMTSRS